MISTINKIWWKIKALFWARKIKSVINYQQASLEMLTNLINFHSTMNVKFKDADKIEDQ